MFGTYYTHPVIKRGFFWRCLCCQGGQDDDDENTKLYYKNDDLNDIYIKCHVCKKNILYSNSVSKDTNGINHLYCDVCMNGN